MSAIELAHDGAATLTAQMEYAKVVSTASLLPESYRGKPADILVAVGLGQSMGLSPAESLYRIAVIKGKPTASAELIAANVRKAGHRLRVETLPDGSGVKATIWRTDDPEFPHTVIRDMAWAKDMGLVNNDNYKKQALTMLQWRAITAVARLACPEALYGVQYTPDEAEGFDDAPAAPSGLAAALAAVEVVEVVEPELTADDLREMVWLVIRQDPERLEELKTEWAIAHDEPLATTQDIEGLKALLAEVSA